MALVVCTAGSSCGRWLCLHLGPVPRPPTEEGDPLWVSWNHVSRKANVDWKGEAGVREAMRRLVQAERLPRNGMRTRTEGGNPRQTQQTREKRAGRAWGQGGVHFYRCWKEGAPLIPGLPSPPAPSPPERCLNPQWRGVSWWSGTVFASPTVAGPLKPPVSEPHAFLPCCRDDECRDRGLLGFCRCINQKCL